jgi:hypothetical protein
MNAYDDEHETDRDAHGSERERWQHRSEIGYTPGEHEGLAPITQDQRENDHDRGPSRGQPGQQDDDTSMGDEGDMQFTPSQAEGDRDTIEGDLARYDAGGDRDNTHYSTGEGGQGDQLFTPSQAEGDRDTTEGDLDG